MTPLASWASSVRSCLAQYLPPSERLVRGGAFKGKDQPIMTEGKLLFKGFLKAFEATILAFSYFLRVCRCPYCKQT